MSKVLLWRRGLGYTAFSGRHRIGTAKKILNNWWIVWVKRQADPPELVEYEEIAKERLRMLAEESCK